MFFIDSEGGFVAAEVEADSVFRVLRSETLFTVGGNYLFQDGGSYYDIGPDDERFLMLRVLGFGGDSGDSRFILVVNWFEELRERLGGN